MNNGYYVNYLANSTCYKNLNEAKKIVYQLLKDINDVISVLNDATGDIFNKMIIDLTNLKLRLNSIKDQANSVQDALMANAKVFDGVLSNWKQKIGTVYKSYQSDVPQKIGYTTINSEIIRDVKVDGSGYISVIIELISTTTDSNNKIISRESMGTMGRIVKFS